MTTFTNIPTTSPFGQLFGGPGTAYVTKDQLQDVILLDRTVFGGRFNNITSHLRADMSGSGVTGNYNMAAYEIDTRWHSMYKGIVYTVPADVIPGSDFVSGTNSGATVATRGGLVHVARGTNIDFFFGMRPITIAGTYGQTTTFGSWNYASGTIASTGIPSWEAVEDIGTAIANYHLFPTSTDPGDTFELGLWVRRANAAEPGHVMGWMSSEITQLATS